MNYIEDNTKYLKEIISLLFIIHVVFTFNMQKHFISQTQKLHFQYNEAS